MWMRAGWMGMGLCLRGRACRVGLMIYLLDQTKKGLVTQLEGTLSIQDLTKKNPNLANGKVTIDAGDNIQGSSVAHELSHSTRVKDNYNVDGNTPGEDSFMPNIKVNNVQYDTEND